MLNVAELRKETDKPVVAIVEAALRELLKGAKTGRGSVTVMTLKAGTGYDPKSERDGKLEKEALIGIAARVFKRCEPFAPTLERYSTFHIDSRDGEEHREQGFNLVIHWGQDMIARLDQLGIDALAAAVRDTVEEIEHAVATASKAILDKLEAEANAQAKANQDSAIAMVLKRDQDFHPPAAAPLDLKHCEVSWLGPVASAVWEACADLNPTLECWSMDGGVDRTGERNCPERGVNIVIHW
jgi:hypothetical protein